MNNKKKIWLATSFIAVAMLTSCQGNNNTEIPDSDDFIKQKFVDFTESKNPIFTESDGWSNGDVFGVTWSEANISYSKDGMKMQITKSENGTYYGGEQKTTGDEGVFKYGYFGTYMKPSNVSGVCSTFFTYTGATEDNPHDEIDIEFMGKDTTKVQFNYFVNGVGNHEIIYDLGFDASEEYHQYGFKWTETEIVWYVDLKPVHSITGTTPSAGQRIFQNVWICNPEVGHLENWLGDFDDESLKNEVSAKYTKVTYADLDGNARVVDNPDLAPTTDDFVSTPISFSSTSEYTVKNNDNNSSDVTYTNVKPKTYKNIYCELGDAFAKTKYMAFTIKNNNLDDYVKVRVDMQMKEKFQYSQTSCANAKAWMDGNVVKTNLTYGGSFFDVPASTSVDVIIEYYGIPVKFLLMLDSSSRSDKDVFSGNVTFSDYKIGGFQEYDPIKAAEDEANKIPDAIEIEPNKVGNYLMDTTWTSNSLYTCTKNDNVTTVDYSVAASNYVGLAMKNSSSFSFQDLQYFDITIQNLNDAKFDIALLSKDENNSLATTKGELVSGDGSYTRLGSNGAYFAINANGTATLREYVNSSNLPKIRMVPAIGGTSAQSGSFKILKFVAYAGLVDGGTFLE